MKKLVSVMLSVVLMMSCICVTVSAVGHQYTSDYRQWSQGASGYPKVKKYGCFIVAMAKMIVESGVDTSSSFNPDVFAEWEAENGHIASLDKVGQKNKLGPQKYAELKGKKLTYKGSVSYSDSDLWNYINSGYYCIVYISYANDGSHFVFVDSNQSKSNGELMFYESGKSSVAIGSMNKSKLLSRYSGSSIKKIYVYEGSSQNMHIHNYKYDVENEKCSCGAVFPRTYTTINAQYKVITNNVSLKSKPYADYGTIYAKLASGTVVTVKRSFKNVYGNIWYEVDYNGKVGYMYSGHLQRVQQNNTVKENTRVGIVNIPSSWDNLSIRTGPSTNYAIVGSMNHGARCTVYPDKAKNGWYYVEYNGIKGYAAGNRIILQ